VKGFLVPLCAPLVLAGCGKGAVEAAFRPRFEGVSLADVPPAEPSGLLGYRWEGSGIVPLVGPPPAKLPFGPRGRTPSTRLYLTFDGSLDQELEAAPRWSREAQGLEVGQDPPPAGRFGRGARIAPRVVVAFDCTEPSAPAVLTIEFWIRPLALARGPILVLPGILALHCRERGELSLEVESGAAQRASGSAVLAPGRWSHVGIVVDPLELEAARLVLDDRPFGCSLKDATPLQALERLELGGGELDFELDELRVSARAANSSEFIAAFEGQPRPLERLDLVTNEGARTLEVWTDFQREPRVERVAQWRRAHLEHVECGVDGLRWASGDWQELRPLDPPLARTCHPTVALGDGRLFVYSGEVRDSHLPPMHNVEDTWFFHTREARWERVPTALAPAGRCHQQAAFSPDHGLVLMPSGWGNGPGREEQFADTWVFHVAERRWEERHPAGATPPSSGEWALVYHPTLRRFLMFSRTFVYAYDPAKDRWDQRQARVTDEEGRVCDYAIPPALSAAYDPVSEDVVLFGGEVQGQAFFDRTLIYRPKENRFIVLDLATHPSARVRPGFAYDPRGKRMVLFGGVRDQFSRRMDDLWEFDPAARRWARIDAAGTPSERGGFMLMAWEPELERFFLVGGRHAPDRFLEEVWTLTLDERAQGRARIAFDRAGFRERTFTFDGDAPGDARLEFRFRASESGLDWGDWSASAEENPRFLEVEATLAPGSQGQVPTLRALGFR
jgi:hypothetical protein